MVICDPFCSVLTDSHLRQWSALLVHPGRPIRSGGAAKRAIRRTGHASHGTRTARDRQRQDRSIGRRKQWRVAGQPASNWMMKDLP